MMVSDETGSLPHGGRLAAARRCFPGAPEPFLDLSTGINPVPYPLPPIAADTWTRLPEPESLQVLQNAAAHAYGLADPASVVAAPGTQILISLLPHLLGHPSAAVLTPTYGEYAAAWRNAGHPIREVADLGDFATAGVGILCNPNNPDGRRHSPATLLALADRFAANGGLLLVDEAFADFDAALSMASALPHPALLILRSFGKAYGLAGLRLGFALCAPRLAARLRTALGPWAVSGPAAVIATRALGDRAWRDRTGAALACAATRLDALLAASGLRLLGGTSLFRLAAAHDAAALHGRLGAAGLLVRRFDAHPTWLRFGLPTDQPAWDRLESALRT